MTGYSNQSSVGQAGSLRTDWQSIQASHARLFVVSGCPAKLVGLIP
jgi:hypothetical protein